MQYEELELSPGEARRGWAASHATHIVEALCHNHGITTVKQAEDAFDRISTKIEAYAKGDDR
jgi:hypothetical protein